MSIKREDKSSYETPWAVRALFSVPPMFLSSKLLKIHVRGAGRVVNNLDVGHPIRTAVG